MAKLLRHDILIEWFQNVAMVKIKDLGSDWTTIEYMDNLFKIPTVHNINVKDYNKAIDDIWIKIAEIHSVSFVDLLEDHFIPRSWQSAHYPFNRDVKNRLI